MAVCIYQFSPLTADMNRHVLSDQTYNYIHNSKEGKLESSLP